MMPIPLLYYRIYVPALILLKRNKIFQFRGREYRYFFSKYNTTAINERCIEVPIIRQELLSNRGKRILEVGNVLSHYFPTSHDIVDKYERGTGVINEDICTYAPGKTFDLIISISTLEHVGYDESPRQPEAVLRAMENIRALLAPGGQAWITFPAGYNPFLKDYLEEGDIDFDESYGMKRISRWNDWIECSPEEALRQPYGPPHAPNATGILIGMIQK